MFSDAYKKSVMPMVLILMVLLVPAPGAAASSLAYGNTGKAYMDFIRSNFYDEIYSYTIMDVNGDGNDELIISSANENKGYPTIQYKIYSYQNGSVSLRASTEAGFGSNALFYSRKFAAIVTLSRTSSSYEYSFYGLEGNMLKELFKTGYYDVKNKETIRYFWYEDATQYRDLAEYNWKDEAGKELAYRAYNEYGGDIEEMTFINCTKISPINDALNPSYTQEEQTNQADSVYTEVYDKEIPVEERIHSMEGIIRSYANQFKLGQDEKYYEIDVSFPDNPDFWSYIYIYSITGWKTDFSYTLDQIREIAYSLFRDYDGTLPAYPDSFTQRSGPVKIEGDRITFMPAQPEEKELEYLMHTVNEDGSVDVLYLERIGAGDPFSTNNFFISVRFTPNMHRNQNSGHPFYYTVDSCHLIRDLLKNTEADSEDRELDRFLGAYLCDVTPEEVAEADYAMNPQITTLYIDKEGHLIRYIGMTYSTTGTDHYYLYSDYKIEGNMFRGTYNCTFGYNNSHFEEPGGTTEFILNDDGNLIEGEHTWYSAKNAEATSSSADTPAVAKMPSGNQTAGEYIFPESGSRYLKAEDVNGLDAETLRRGRNEIFARHGRRFKDENLQAYFDSKSWYNGIYEPDDFNTDVLNDYELKNIDFLKKTEDAGR